MHQENDELRQTGREWILMKKKVCRSFLVLDIQQRCLYQQLQMEKVDLIEQQDFYSNQCQLMGRD